MMRSCYEFVPFLVRKNGVTFFTVKEEEGFQILWERKEDEPPLTKKERRRRKKNKEGL